MSAEVCFHQTKRITAKVVHQSNLHFVELSLRDAFDVTVQATVFFSEPGAERAATSYAAGINEIDKALHPVTSIADVLRRSKEREDA